MAESSPPSAPPRPSASGGPAARLAGIVAARPFAALAVIVVLLFLVIGLLAYYRGLWVFGPYAAAAAVSRGTKARAKDESSGDDETERLIAAINHESGARDEKAGAPRD